jgi:hypothetical protein
MLRIQKLSLAFGSILTLCSAPVWAGGPGAEGPARLTATAWMPAPQVQQRLDDLFYRWETYELDLPAVERQVRETGRVTLHAGSRVFDLELELNNLRAPGFKRVRETRRGPVEEGPTPVATFKGHVVGDPESIVRLLIQPDLFEGYIHTADEWIFIDPLRKYARSSAPSEIVLFDADDVRPEAAVHCGSGELTRRAHRLLSRESSRGPGSIPEKALIAPPALRQVDIAIEADYDYYLAFGASAYSQMESILNGVDGIYRADLALTLRIVYEYVWTTNQTQPPNPPYPYTSSVHSTLLDQFAGFWNSYRTNVARDVAHLFTGKQLVDQSDPPNVKDGVAYPAAACRDASRSYSLSRNRTLSTKLAAHEIAHVFGAAHDDELTPPAATCIGSGPIMCGSIQSNGPSSFSDRSKETVSGYVNNYCATFPRLSMTYYTILTNQTPQTQGAGTGYEAGNQFSSSQDGYITALRFWKACGETGAHVGNLWADSNRTKPLVSVAFHNETSCGWQEEYLPYRVKITAGTLYWMTYNENAWQVKTGCGISPPITNGPLTAWGSAYSDANSAGIFPIHGSCSNFFADVYFTP